MSDAARVVRWGILGTARIAERVGAAIHQARDAELSAVASRTQDRAAEWAAKHNVPRSHGSYQALLDDPDLDAVYIPLPPALHLEWTVRAAECGKHVLCEKPFATSTADAEAMWTACRQHNVQLMDGVMWLHHPRATDMLRTIQAGTLGELRRVTSAFSFKWDVFPENDIRLSRDMGGGCLLDLGWYCVGVTLWAFGGLPQKVFGTGRYERDVEMAFSALMWYDNQRMASFDCAFEVQPRRWLEVAGTEASLACNDVWRAFNEDEPRFALYNRYGLLSEQVCAPSIQEVCMIENFCEIIRSGQLDERWPSQSIAIQRVCEALDRSARTGESVQLSEA